MAEIRVDPETADWRIIAPERAARPVDRPGAAAPACPFCPGHEAMTPPEVLRVPASAQQWHIRVVPNLFAFVAPAAGSDGARPVSGDLAGPAVPAVPATGRHEVLIESDRHDWDLRRATPDEAAAILFAARERCRILAAQNPAAIIVFRNYGAAAGNSLIHPHSQIVALDQAPPGLMRRWRRAREYHADTGRRLHDDIAAAERAAATRLVADTDGVVVFQPQAASVPHETTIIPAGDPADDSADLAGASDRALTDLARTLPRVLAGLAAVLNDPAYNLVIHAAPTNAADAKDWFRWHITLYPRITTHGGLELATGLAVNPTAPENTAPILRAALTAQVAGPDHG